MATTVEGIQAKLSMDTTMLAPAKRDIVSFAETGHSGFLKVGSAAKGFKAVLHEVGEQSPIMGGALRIALSPVAGLFMAAAAGVAFFKERLKELNELLDKVAAANAKSFGDLKAAIVDAHHQILAERRAYAAMVAELVSPLKEVEKALGREEDQLKRNYDIARARRDLEKGAVLENISRQVAAGKITKEEGAGRTAAVETHYAAEEGRAKFADLQQRIAMEQRWLSEVDRAQKHVQANVEDYTYGRESKQRETRLTRIGAIDRNVKDMQSDIVARKAIMETTQGAYDEFVAAAQGSKKDQVAYAFSHLPDDMVKFEQYRGARDLINSQNRAIAEQLALRKKLVAAEEASEDKHKTAVKDLKELQGQHEKYTDSIAKLGAERDQVARTPIVFQPPRGEPQDYTPMPGRPDLDAKTGGYGLHPLRLKMPYKVLGVSSVLGNAGPDLKPKAESDPSQKLLQQLVDAAVHDGLVIKEISNGP